MYVKSLTIKDFRNYVMQRVELSPSLNVFTGRNAVGKTNLLEAVYVLGIGKSPKTVSEKEVVRFGANSAYVKGEIIKTYSKHTIDLSIDKAEKKRVAVDGLPIKKLGELMGVLGVVYFSPDELGLIKNSPSVRRKFMDVALSQQSRTYYYTLGKYGKSLLQRNKLLKSGGESLSQTLDIWDEQIAKEGAFIIQKRREFLLGLSKIAGNIHEEVSLGDKLELEYETLTLGENLDEIKENLIIGLQKNRERDIYLGYTSVGPHRDDIAVTTNGLDTRKYSSQGQQRTAALSLKLSELEMFKQAMGEYPVLLLDDVLSELDEKRQAKLLDATKNVQTLLTCTHFDSLPFGSATEFIVEGGEKANKISKKNK